ncbi:MAG: hypothetical protein PHX38_12845, partial [Sulfuricella sp.]|nr:hypothetical protein [Sulfuricella sp.]
TNKKGGAHAPPFLFVPGTDQARITDKKLSQLTTHKPKTIGITIFSISFSLIKNSPQNHF